MLLCLQLDDSHVSSCYVSQGWTSMSCWIFLKATGANIMTMFPLWWFPWKEGFGGHPVDRCLEQQALPCILICNIFPSWKAFLFFTCSRLLLMYSFHPEELWWPSLSPSWWTSSPKFKAYQRVCAAQESLNSDLISRLAWLHDPMPQLGNLHWIKKNFSSYIWW